MTDRPEPRSAAVAIWNGARARGASSPAAYHRALRTASILDTGRAALERVEEMRSRQPLDTGAALALVRDVRLMQLSVCIAGRQIERQRRRAFIDPFVATPPALDRGARQRLDRLQATVDALDPAANALLGALAGTPDAAGRALGQDPLFAAGAIAAHGTSITLDEVAALIEALHEALVDGFLGMASRRSIPTRALGRARRVVAPRRSRST